MSFSTRGLQQEITYWPPSATNRFGQSDFGAPVKIKGRWEDKVQQVTRPSGEEITSTSIVFVDRDVLIGGHLIEGDYSSQMTPVDNAREIQAYNTTPDLRSLEKERVAYL